MVAPLPGWLVPDWPAPPSVRAVFTTRQGGVSAAPFDSFNLGDHVGDAPAAVAANRDRLHQALGAQPVFMRQVHGVRTADLDAWSPDAAETVADACSTARSGLACTVMVADCLPVLFCTRDGRAVGAAFSIQRAVGWARSRRSPCFNASTIERPSTGLIDSQRVVMPPSARIVTCFFAAARAQT